jgi:hypothetical protein
VKKFFISLSGLSLVILIGLGVFFGLAVQEGTNLDRECTAFVNKAVPAIVAHWDEAEFYRYSDQDALRKANLTPEQTQKFFAWFRSLGDLKQYRGSKGSSTVDYIDGKKTITGRYVAVAEFQAGPASIEVDLSKSTGQWKITAMNVKSPALLNMLTKTAK